MGTPSAPIAVQRCIRCQRANPLDAAFCHFDGIPLRTVQVGVPISVKSESPPILDIAPRRLHVPDLNRGESRIAMLTILNRGQGILQGEIDSDGVDWLRLPGRAFRIAREEAFEVRIETQSLPGTGHFFTKLRVTTNGGAVEVPVQIDVTRGGYSFQGYRVADANELAKLMLAHPKKAVGWFADGHLQRFFAERRWPFPIVGPVAPGLAAVQQYFESLKLTRVPDVYAETALVDVVCQTPERATRSVRLYTDAKKKWVYGFVESSSMWLIPMADAVGGARECDLRFDVDSSLMEPGMVHEGVLRVTVNGRRQLSIVVRVDVSRPDEPWTRKLLRPLVG
jgi:hypothetical protein